MNYHFWGISLIFVSTMQASSYYFESPFEEEPATYFKTTASQLGAQKPETAAYQKSAQTFQKITCPLLEKGKEKTISQINKALTWYLEKDLDRRQQLYNNLLFPYAINPLKPANKSESKEIKSIFERYREMKHQQEVDFENKLQEALGIKK